MSAATPATYGLLGMLATQSMTGYELTQQVRRSLRFVWATSEGHLYREQKKLVALGWASVSDEVVGKRTRQRYAITRAGRAALRGWLASPPEEPHLQVEGVLRAFYADSAGPAELAASLRSTADAARAMLAELGEYVDDYLAEGGPLELLEQGQQSGAFQDRTVFPPRLPSVAIALDITTELLSVLERFCRSTADAADTWESTSGPELAGQTRQWLERARRRTG